jgi:sodium/bile acid cotransporter 7
MRRLFAVLLRNAFLVGLLTALLLALVWPRPGGPDGFLRADLLSKLGIMLIFFLQGLSLPTSELSRGFRSLRLHAFIQACIFLLAPLFLLPLALAFKLLFNETLASGFIFLALLPTTISSAVAFTSTAGGNTAAALFNTTLANVLGVFWVPLGSILLLSSESGLPLNLVLPLLLKLSWLLLLPLLAGQCLRPLLHEHDLFRLRGISDSIHFPSTKKR